MSEAVIVALITGGLSLIGTFVSNNRTAQSMDASWTSSRPSPKQSWRS